MTRKLVIECDRCKTEIQVESTSTTLSVRNPMPTDPNYRGDRKLTNYDICANCAERLKTFLENGPKVSPS